MGSPDQGHLISLEALGVTALSLDSCSNWMKQDKVYVGINITQG